MKRRNKKEVEIVKEQEKEIINVASTEKKGFNKKTGIIIGAVIALVGAGVVIIKRLSGLEPTDYDLDDYEENKDEDEDESEE